MFKHGDLVQMTRLGIKRQAKGNGAGYYPKTEKTHGIFLSYRGGNFGQPAKHPVALVRWSTGVANPEYRESLTRVDYLEPLGAPR